MVRLDNLEKEMLMRIRNCAEILEDSLDGKANMRGHVYSSRNFLAA